jgi:hypothetical protein
MATLMVDVTTTQGTMFLIVDRVSDIARDVFDEHSITSATANNELEGDPDGAVSVISAVCVLMSSGVVRGSSRRGRGRCGFEVDVAEGA